MTNPYATPASRKRIWVISSLMVIFLVPLLLAWYLVGHKGFLWTRHTNNGVLITPPFSLSQLKIYNDNKELMDNDLFSNRENAPTSERVIGQWTLFLINSSQCDQSCQTGLYNMRQVRLATGKDQNRVVRAVLNFKNKTTSEAIHAEITKGYEGTEMFWIDSEQFQSVIQMSVHVPYASQEGALYIVDPLGNVMMVYEPNFNPSKILEDLQHLLKVSQIG